jgi:hypothetical protein
VGTRRIAILAVIIVAAGCSGGHKGPLTPKARAATLCRATVHDSGRLVSSDPTTVGAIRGVTIATIGPFQTHSFPTLTASAFGAWCWTVKDGTYTIYKAAGTTAIAVADEQVKSVPSGQAHGAPTGFS